MKKLCYLFAFMMIAILAVNCGKDKDDKNTKNGTWKQLTNFGGYTGSIAFAINGKVYVLGSYNDFWEYDPATNKWTQKLNFPDNSYGDIASFSIKNKGYVCVDKTLAESTLWEYDAETNQWTQKVDITGPGYAFVRAACFASENKAYICRGDGTLWEYNPATNQVTQKANFLEEYWKIGTKGVYLNDKGYVFSGYRGSGGFANSGFWEYDIKTDQWVRKSDLPHGLMGGIGFTVNNKIYVGLGGDIYGYDFKQIYEFDVDGNCWTLKTEYPGSGSAGTIAVVVQNKVYIGLGSSSYYHQDYNDFWQYIP